MGWGVQWSRYCGTKSCRVLFNSTRVKAIRRPGVAKCRVSDGQWPECTGNVVSQVHFLQRGTSVEQQMKLPTADKAHVSYSDACVVRGGGLPRGCRIPNLQILSAKKERHVTIGPHSGGRGNPSPCEAKPRASGGVAQRHKHLLLV